MFRTLSDKVAQKLVYSDFLDFVVIITECLFDSDTFQTMWRMFRLSRNLRQC